jgi:hypothetical protein
MISSSLYCCMHARAVFFLQFSDLLLLLLIISFISRSTTATSSVDHAHRDSACTRARYSYLWTDGYLSLMQAPYTTRIVYSKGYSKALEYEYRVKTVALGTLKRYSIISLTLYLEWYSAYSIVGSDGPH